ncbi:hypothetical protein V492_03277 [Pseudogymnoascus sp. VKM F-4246]|nr:hypothetical protein V492_03277 [Pseudogymnoascus sp. VKM F-4246]
MSAPPFKVKAVYEYTSPHEDDLHFPNGQIITVTEEEDDDWYSGEYVDAEGVKQEGIFPRNFVEKYEPQAPPRPVRSARPKKEAEPAAPAQPPTPDLAPAPVVAEKAPEPVPEPIVAETPVAVEEVVETTPPKIEAPAPTAPKQVEKPAAPAQVAPKAAAPPAGRSSPPAESDKPTGSFRDRIAAFNKSAAPPPAPFKPGGLGGGSSFIKKPFVPPPPSKNAYIPPPRDTPVAKIYRREEDPEIAARETENQESAEKAGLAATGQEGEEEQPKPTSLKERIALLQKQQAEQAARHADAAQKKEKPKRPTKKRTDSQPIGEPLDGEEVPLEKKESHDTVGRQSIDSSRDDTARQQPQRRKSSKGPPAIPAHAVEADGNDADMSGAGDETEEPDTGHEDSDAKPNVKSFAPPPPARGPIAPAHEADVGDEEDVASEREEAEEGEDEEEEEEVDPEVRRKEEIRARMAKMSGGMGMHGMFGPPGGMPMPMAAAPKKKKAASGDSSRPSGEYDQDEASPTSSRAPQVPVMALPGLSKVRTPEEMPSGVVTGTHEPEEIPDVEDTVGTVAPAPSERRPAPQRASMSHDSFRAPAVPGGRPAPPPVPVESRPAPIATPLSPSAGSESDDELSTHARVSAQTPTGEAPPKLAAAPSLPIREEKPVPSALATTNAGSYEPSPVSPVTPGANKRASRVPPIPGASAVVGSAQTRAPPPPPPTGSLSRASTGDARFAPVPTTAQREDSDDEEVTEYEGDYDTDIASTEPHKDALKAPAREPSIDDESARSSFGSPAGPPPPLPPVAAPRGVPPPLPSQPPPLPSQPPPHARQSLDMPRAVPPPPPPPKQETPQEHYEEDEEYDPFKYTAPKSGIPVSAATVRKVPGESEDLYSSSPPRHAPPHDGRAPPPPPPHGAAPPALPAERAAPPPPPRDLAPTPTNRALPRQSADVQRSAGPTRRSTDLNRMSMDHGFIANDVDLGEGSLWWTNPSGVPPAFHGRKDLLHEAEESTVSKRGGKSVTTKDLYVLFPDYSQTVVTVQFDPQNPSDASFEQRHEQPPSRLRQDQLEEAHERFGSRIHDAVVAKKETVVADGTPAGLIIELLKPFKDALLPIGTRAYGALVYSNLGNSLTSQFDEIRPGDIITLRNAKFQGKHGPMHAKYTAEVGRGDGHVGVVSEWDGPKKKVRAWEQGRESKKVKLESFKLDDLRSGEVKIWRIMPRSWVGWEGENSK